MAWMVRMLPILRLSVTFFGSYPFVQVAVFSYIFMFFTLIVLFWLCYCVWIVVIVLSLPVPFHPYHPLTCTPSLFSFFPARSFSTTESSIPASFPMSCCQVCFWSLLTIGLCFCLSTLEASALCCLFFFFFLTAVFWPCARMLGFWEHLSAFWSLLRENLVPGAIV